MNDSVATPPIDVSAPDFPEQFADLLYYAETTMRAWAERGDTDGPIMQMLVAYQVLIGAIPPEGRLRPEGATEMVYQWPVPERTS